MNESLFIDLISADYKPETHKGCDAIAGLVLMQSVLPSTSIESAEHDKIFSASIGDLIAAGISEQQVIKLRSLGWFVEYDEYMATFV